MATRASTCASGSSRDSGAALAEAAALRAAGKHAEALARAQAALALDPQSAGLLDLAAVCAHALQEFDLAERLWRDALRVKPDFAEAHFHLATQLRKQGRAEEAVAALRAAVAANPRHVDALSNLGALLRKLKHLDEAEAVYRKAVALEAASAESHYNFANLLADMGRLAEAETAYRRAIALREDFPQAINNLANLLNRTRQYREAETLYRGMIARHPEHAQAHCDLGAHLYRLQRLEEAEAAYRRAISLQPESPGARMRLGMLHLLRGEFEKGWPLYESRSEALAAAGIVSTPTLPFPPWRGEPLRGKSLMLWPEQGLGDTLQFVRYVPLLKAMGAKHVTLACAPALKSLLGTVAGADAVATSGEALLAHDYWTQLLSLPLRFGTTLDTIPAALPYLEPDPARFARWTPRLPAARRRVGLVWKGSESHVNDANRSLPGLTALAPLWSVPDIGYVSLQVGAGGDEARNPPPGQAITDLGPDIGDFADTAAIIARLDLVICVDTAVAHLAGALGRPCWVLLPAIEVDWRWLVGRADSPWYPGIMRLFRRQMDQPWEDAIAGVAAALREWVRKPPAPAAA